jgi:hypothetical protein
MAVGAYLHKKSQGQVTLDEIEAIRPVLNLSENQKLYLDCVKAVLESRILLETQKASWLASLNASLDQSMELQNLDRLMRESIGATSVTEIHGEVARLEARMNESLDATNQEIFRQSLEMAKERLMRSEGLAGQLERAEAHLELTRQTFIKTRETLRGLEIGTQQNTRHDLEPLRANLSNVQAEAFAIRAAIDELALLRTDI